jgi:hypothetical protein
MKVIINCLLLITLLSVSTFPVESQLSDGSPATEVFGVSHAAHIQPTFYYGQEIIDFNSLVGKDISTVMYFSDWSSWDVITGEFFNFYLLRMIQKEFGEDGPVVMLTWVPINGRASLAGKPACDRDYNGAIPLDDVIAGKCDNYIKGFAQALKSRPERFLLRFAHEMNIDSTSWWPKHFGLDASKYVQMWRHIYSIFASQQVSNVEWVWSPNYASHPDRAWNDLHNYYPGDSYVDWIGLSGYNWYSTRGLPWFSFEYLYNDVLIDLACNYPKPQIIAEIGTVDGGPSKASWIDDAYNKILSYPFLRVVTWFNDYAYADPAEPDFRVTTGTDDFGSVSPLPLGSGEWTNAYRQAISNPVYKSNLPSLQSVTPPRVYCGETTPVFEVNPSDILIEPGDSSRLVLTGLLYTNEQSLDLDFNSYSYFMGSTITPNVLFAPWGQAYINLKSSNSTPLGTYTIYVKIGSRSIPIRIRVVAFVGRQYLPAIQKLD